MQDRATLATASRQLLSEFFPYSITAVPRILRDRADVELVNEMTAAIDHAIDLNGFREALERWGQRHFRQFPWRQTRNPYNILVAEVLLHRTRAPQVIPVYQKLVARYPDARALAHASKQELQAALQSLGLRWRTDLLHAMAAELAARFGGEIPRNKQDLLSLPGVSEYIASATLCFAWNEPEAIVDTNTVRVVARLFGIEIRDSLRRNRRFRELVRSLVDPANARAYNFAMLDLAAAVCTPKEPAHDDCPVLAFCRTGSQVLSNT